MSKLQGVASAQPCTSLLTPLRISFKFFTWWVTEIESPTEKLCFDTKMNTTRVI